jgi:endonuclease G
MKNLVGLVLIAFASLVNANEIDLKCKQHVAYGAPVVYKEGNNQYLCRIGYAVNYNYNTKVAHYVVEHVTAANLAKNAVRGNDFREDPQVPPQYRQTLADYTGMGFDRGHMAPAANMTFNAQAMSESFFLTNMMPQVPGNNRGIWKYLEETTRYWVQTKGEVYVITGTIFAPQPKMMNKVAIPAQVYKIVIDPKTGKQIAYLFPNEKLDPKLIDQYAVTVANIEQRTGINFSPLLPANLANAEKTVLHLKDF